MQFQDKNVLIFGLGRYPEGSGVSAARFFVHHGAKVTVTDLKTAKELRETVRLLKRVRVTRYALPVTFHLGGHRMSDVRRADLIVRNPGVPSHSSYLGEARRRGIPVMTDVSLFMQLCPCPVIGVTGTRGKSTTTALIGAMVRRMNKKTFVGGNIQRSPLTFLDKLDAGSLVVLELSSWLLESLADIRQSPWAAVVTNIYPDHLNIHRSMREYVRAKENIFRFQKRGDILVLNRDNPETRRMGARTAGERLWFSMKPFGEENGGFIRGDVFIFRFEGKEEVLARRKDLILGGAHNLQNALAAMTLARRIGVSAHAIRAALRTFRGLPSRQEIVRVRYGVTWVNDTTATTPEATIAALQRFNEWKNIVLIAGGADKKLKFDELAREIKKYCKAVILFDGTATPKLLKRLTAHRLPLIARVHSMRAAVKAAQKFARRGDIVLLSPGCASFGLFQNEFDRGKQFVELIRK